ncbi:MAG: hypothetical protein JSS98_00865, partial [Bacteroidetes bacterium]|nr:hypothetical protein [Bacteroidota bacterium]
MQEPGREYSPSSGSEHYRYSFNGKEQDPETYGQGNIYDYGFRIYNPRLGRFLSIDPLFRSYPWYTPYQFASNYPIVGVDIEGLENSILINNNEINKQVQANKYGRTPEPKTNPSPFFSNRKKESIEALKQFGKGALLAGAIALDIFVTKGWATKAVVGYEVISAFQHN